jgi:hypothetical protein
MTQQATKVADLRYITTLKNKPYIKIYTYRSGDDTKDYQVTTVHGKVSSCSTPATHPCYICRDAQAREDASKPLETSQKGALNGSSQGFSLLR